MSSFEIIEADLSIKHHADAIQKITNLYAKEPMGQNEPLQEYSQKHLIEELRNFPLYLGLLAWRDGQPAGLANCFYGFSTFKAARVLNIHDLVVLKDFRSMGLGQALINYAVKKAKQQNCCKVTLEVREDNRAKRLYEREGFSHGDPAMYFMSKELI